MANDHSERRQLPHRAAQLAWPKVRALGAPAVRAALLLLIAFSVGVMTYDYRLARHSTAQGVFAIFWLSFLLAFACAACLGLSVGHRWSRDAVLLVFGIFTFVPKFLMSVSGPRYFDEYGHFRHANDVIESGNLLAPLPYQPIIRDFPGLSMATIAVRTVTRLSVWHSGQMVVLLAHCGSLLVVAAIARGVGASGRAAFLAGMIYALNPSFMYFDSQFSYESLGLPLGFVAIWACIRSFTPSVTRVGAAAPADRARTSRWAGVGGFAVSGCVVTHHLSALFMSATCVVIAVCFTVRRVRRDPGQSLMAGWLVTGWAVAATTLWLALVATSLGGYLGPHFRGALTQLLQITGLKSTPAVSGNNAPKRSLFAGSRVPLYEKVAAYTTPFLALALVVAATYLIWRRRHTQASLTAAVAPFVILTAGYFVSLPLAFTTDGSEITHRSWGYSYLGIAVVLGLGCDRLARESGAMGRRLLALCAVALVPLAVGNIATGVDVTYRFPGPYQFGTDTRSASSELTRVTTWLNAHAAPNTGVVTDRFTSEAITAYTRTRVPSPNQTLPLTLFAQPEPPSSEVRAALRAGNFEFFVLDEHILTNAPPPDFYLGSSSYLPVNVAGLRDLPAARILEPAFTTEHYIVYRIHA